MLLLQQSQVVTPTEAFTAVRHPHTISGSPEKPVYFSGFSRQNACARRAQPLRSLRPSLRDPMHLTWRLWLNFLKALTHSHDNASTFNQSIPRALERAITAHLKLGVARSTASSI